MFVDLDLDKSKLIYHNFLYCADSPKALINTMWWNNTLHFGLRGRQEHIQMRWGDVELKHSSTGEEYLEFSERATKTRNGIDGDSRAFKPKLFANPGIF